MRRTQWRSRADGLPHGANTRSQVSQGRSDGSLAAVFLEQAGVLLDNCQHADLPVCSSAATCTSHLVSWTDAIIIRTVLQPLNRGMHHRYCVCL